jgi:hypothetical protein
MPACGRGAKAGHRRGAEKKAPCAIKMPATHRAPRRRQSPPLPSRPCRAGRARARGATFSCDDSPRGEQGGRRPLSALFRRKAGHGCGGAPAGPRSIALATLSTSLAAPPLHPAGSREKGCASEPDNGCCRIGMHGKGREGLRGSVPRVMMRVPVVSLVPIP